jgi:hypothetical protein
MEPQMNTHTHRFMMEPRKLREHDHVLSVFICVHLWLEG